MSSNSCRWKNASHNFKSFIMERIRKSFRRRKNKDRDGDKKFDFQAVFSEAEADEPKPLSRIQKIRKSIRSIKKKKKETIEETTATDFNQENEKISLSNDDDTDISKEETEEDPLSKKSKFRISFRPKKKKDKNADEIDNKDDKDKKEKKKKKKKGSLTVRPTSRAGTKVGLSDLTVLSGKAVTQRIKVTLGITG